MNQHKSKTSINTPAAVLWACAFLLGALVIVQAGKLPSNSAYADQATSHGAYTLVTASSGRGDDADPNELLYVLNSRDGVVLVYEIEDARKNVINFRHGGSLVGLFNTARR